MHYNLLFNGCSWTFGGELEGIDRDMEYQKTHRYSHLVAEHFGMTYQNISKNGVSNDWIIESTIDWFESGNTCDVAIIQFTKNSRTIWYDENNNNHEHHLQLNIITKKDNDKREKFYLINNLYYKNFYSPFLGFQNFHKNLFFLEKYLTEKNIKYLFIEIANQYSTQNNNYKSIKKGWVKYCSKIHVYPLDKVLGSKTNNREFRIVNENYCKDLMNKSFPNFLGTHPSAIGHQKIANYIIENIKN